MQTLPVSRSKIAVSVTCNNRNDYIYSLLDDIYKNDYLGHDLFIAVEPHYRTSNGLPSLRYDGKATVISNDEQLGVRDNPYSLLHRIFSLGYYGVIYLEDDLLLSSDAFSLARWYLSRPALYCNTVCLNLCNRSSRSDSNPTTTESTDDFNALGIAMTAAQWAKHFEPNWKIDYGWDTNVHQYIRRNGLRTVMPHFARATHLLDARGGTHYEKIRHGDMFINLALYKGPPMVEFVEPPCV